MTARISAKRRFTRSSFARLVASASGPSRRIAQRVAGERDERVLQIGPMQMEFHDAASGLTRHRDYFGYAFDALHSEHGARAIARGGWKFAHTGQRASPSGLQRHPGGEFQAAFRPGERHQLRDWPVGDYASVIDQDDSRA